MNDRPLFGSIDPLAREHGAGTYQARHAAALARGFHPLTELPLLPPERGLTCKMCDHCVRRGMVAGTYYKCRKAPITGGPATDVKLKWPACEAFKRENV